MKHSCLINYNTCNNNNSNNMKDNINEVTNQFKVEGDVLAMKFLTVVFEEDTETVAAVLASMDQVKRDGIIDLITEENISFEMIGAARDTFQISKDKLNETNS